MLGVVLGASLFLFLVFFSFVCCSILLYPSMFVLERDTLRFHCSEHSSSHSYCPVSVHFLLALRLALIFLSYFLQSLLVFFSYIWLASGLCWLLSLRVVSNKLIGVGEE
jgi:hypothetical protein